jgi:hypothetical protein
MKLISATIAAIQVSFASASGGFSYKPDSDKAPNAWGSLDLGPTVKNQCGGSSQSGIDVPTSSCDISGDYIFAVRPQGIASPKLVVFSQNILTFIQTLRLFSAWIMHPR